MSAIIEATSGEGNEGKSMESFFCLAGRRRRQFEVIRSTMSLDELIDDCPDGGVRVGRGGNSDIEDKIGSAEDCEQIGDVVHANGE